MEKARGGLRWKSESGSEETHLLLLTLKTRKGPEAKEGSPWSWTDRDMGFLDEMKPCSQLNLSSSAMSAFDRLMEMQRGNLDCINPLSGSDLRQ